MAIGLALLFNIRLPINFNSPYKATNIQDFWRRWHITLSRFLRDYVYIPLGGNRKGGFRAYNNLMATFVIGGLWHGAGWTFIFWGFLHGLALIIHRLWGKLGIKLWTWVAWFITFNFVNITWVFFRAKEWDDAIKVLYGIIAIDRIELPGFLKSKFIFLSKYEMGFKGWLSNISGDYITIIWLFVGFVIILLFDNSVQRLESFKLNYKTLVFSAFLLSVSFLSLQKATEFLYFNF
jgi:D-alanyl-lipoteichoic acid acyltransferase DltB (MBOAT superfamily)